MIICCLCIITRYFVLNWSEQMFCVGGRPPRRAPLPLHTVLQAPCAKASIPSICSRVARWLATVYQGATHPGHLSLSLSLWCQPRLPFIFRSAMAWRMRQSLEAARTCDPPLTLIPRLFLSMFHSSHNLFLFLGFYFIMCVLCFWQNI